MPGTYFVKSSKPRSSPERRAVFLDRDGTINVDYGWVWRTNQLRLLPGVASAIRRLNQAGYLVIVVSNQSCVGRGYCTEEDVNQFNLQLNRELRRRGAHIDAFYFCPHHPTKAKGEYRRSCNCRKPKPGLIKQAMRDFDISPQGSFMIGDAPKDVKAGLAAGLTAIRLTVHQDRSRANATAPDLPEAVAIILARRRQSSR